MNEWIVSILLIIGGFLTLLSSIGLIRLPDVYGRAHAAGKSATLGVMSLMFAAFIYFAGSGIMNAKILLAILFIFITAPVSSLVISRSAYRIGVPLSKYSTHDELKQVEEASKMENVQ
ncbi:monovalent cation/H(+) antiporter subunit G [Niallia sp. XMNu-256]|uniref:monovalent cation/H(+) antiporter subunit G n=1 Tax=Niallia sp. XMNu-256 TaxID=3082444 RepID=UPI0030D1B8EB